MEIPWKKINQSGSRATKKLLYRLSGFTRTAVLSGVCVLGLLNTGKLHLAYAVDNGGDFIAYVNSPEELDGVVDDVQRSVSGALGYWWDAPKLTTYVRLGKADALACDTDAVADWLYDAAGQVEPLELVYVDGKAVCAFRTVAEAAEAVRAISEEYLTEKTETAAFLENITIASGMADIAMLDGNTEALRAAVTVETTRHVTVEEVLPYQTKLTVNNSMYAEQNYIETYGRDGLLVTEYLVTSRNGRMSDYAETDCTRFEPVTQVLVVGSKVRLSTGSYIWPVEMAYISSDFGWRKSNVGSSDHQGIDLAYDYGTPILAADGGKVIFSGTEGGYGKLIMIEHDNGDVTYYAHCSKLLVSEGDIVMQGDQVALMGSTGASTGSHLHFEIHPAGGKAVNPTSMLPTCEFTHMDC